MRLHTSSDPQPTTSRSCPVVGRTALVVMPLGRGIAVFAKTQIEQADQFLRSEPEAG